MRTTPAKQLKIRGVACITHKFLLIPTPESNEYLCKCPLVDCPNGIKRIVSSTGAYFETDPGVDSEATCEA